MKKTIFIVSQKLTGGGAERVASNLSVELSKNTDYKIYMVLFDATNITYPCGCEILDMNLGPEKSILKKTVLFIRRVMDLRRLKKKYKPDISISLLNAANLINVLSHHKEKDIISIRNYLTFSTTSILEKMGVRYSCKKADKIISLSKTVAIDLIQNFGAPSEKVRTIYNSCDPELLIQLSYKKDIPLPGFPYIVTMGRLTKQKGQWHLIKAFSYIHKRIPEMHLIILGEGELKEKLQSLICELNMQQYIHLYGYVESPHVIIKNSKMFILCSLFEGLGNVLLEAMACEVPVLSTDCLAGPKELLTECRNEELFIRSDKIVYGEYGVLTPPFKNEDINETLDLSDEELQLAEACINLITNERLIGEYKEKSKKRSMDFLPKNIYSQWADEFD